MARTYVRRRTTAVLLVLGALALVSGPVMDAWGAGTTDHVRPVARLEVVVREGDTAWDIAQRVAPRKDPRAVVDAIARANAIDAGSLVPGQVVVVPLPASS